MKSRESFSFSHEEHKKPAHIAQVELLRLADDMHYGVEKPKQELHCGNSEADKKIGKTEKICERGIKQIT